MVRQTKIVCTIGPASESPEMLRELIRAGMDVARLNFSHGDYEEHGERIRRIRAAAEEVGKHVGLMLDIKGPKIRTGKIAGGAVELIDGNKITLTIDPVELGTAERVSISYEGLVEDVYPGAPIRIDDGLIGLVVDEVRGHDIICTVVNGGVLKDRKGINVPGVTLRIPGVTEKDAADIRFGIEQRVDFIAASFVRKSADVLEVRRILEEHNYQADIISKIETQEGIERLAEIVEVSDGIMVARGDLGVEIPTEEVPLAQKRMIQMCNLAGKPVITATQMLDSMQRNPRPTRAEASDVANAILDGTDAIMLSGETAAGRYPLEAVKTMAQIASRTEYAVSTKEVVDRHTTSADRNVTDAIGHAVQSMSEELGVSAVVVATTSGHSARVVSKHRPHAMIVAATPRAEVARRLTVSYGVYPVVIQDVKTTDEVLETAVQGALDAGFVSHGDLVIIVAGVPVGQRGTTNLLKVHTIGDVLVTGTGIGSTAVSGRAFVSSDNSDIASGLQSGDILVTLATDKDVVPAMERAAAIITEEGGLTSHAAVVGLTLGKPVIVGAQGAVTTIENGSWVTVDAARGLVYRGKAQVL
ncbi:pyruvate kinase [Alicyclobacillus ferrooxydans]|uniref:Pyruvate kinase n=1 Tax=Alicyclobacillus ferrooxydans TaxID=471514 RepID=A0A0P9CA51_9BACL|nr:pyruvate kinase [Alicyclobacillus ferrooxydans]KPV39918.1 pyruvate kinase [Alicyclobacillus ferrooxydans]